MPSVASVELRTLLQTNSADFDIPCPTSVRFLPLQCQHIKAAPPQSAYVLDMFNAGCTKVLESGCIDDTASERVAPC